MGKISGLTLSEALNKASLFLRNHGYDGALARTYWLMTFDRTLTDLVMALRQPITEDDYVTLFAVLERIVKDEPIQYILGYADFMDRRFKVNQSTLIPREDTAGVIELVLPFLTDNPQAKILDIGTGTGILAVTMSLEFPQATVYASDISEEALKLAKYNADRYGANIHFIESDVFDDINERQFDLIVSNPPYIGEDELDLMDASVKKFEPHMALFAEDQGLAIYKKIAEQIPEYINDQGMIVLEIGYQQGQKVSQLFKEKFARADIKVIQDFNQKDRYVQIIR
ncbi:peptide chain release factor N(5)-glutamine methyltransferase [Aerococcaceae bacterium WGS1372]